jgi:Uri superfamily endonuclease
MPTPAVARGVSDDTAGGTYTLLVGLAAPASVECAVAEGLSGERVPDFGCSDCGCDSHLAFRAGRERLLSRVERAYRRARADARTAGGGEDA